MVGLNVNNVRKRYGNFIALDGVYLQILPGQVGALLGPSGSGKSTLLNIIAGLEKADSGQVFWNDRELNNIPTHERGFGLMFQDYALFPHLSVFDNVSYGLRMARQDRNVIQKRVLEVLSLVGLESLAHRDVNSLSGGEQQRVALARSLAPKPKFLMLDEPLGALDRSLRERLAMDLRTILHHLGQTALYVTHDQEEAFTIADTIFLLNQGRVVQVGSPLDIYQNPNSEFVARFLGMNNLVIGKASGKAIADTEIGQINIPASMEGKIKILLRPDKFYPGQDGPCSLTGKIIETVLRGPICRAVVKVNSTDLVFDLPPQACTYNSGSAIELSYNPEDAIEVWPLNE